MNYSEAQARCHRIKRVVFDDNTVNLVLAGDKTQFRKPITDLPLYEPYFEIYDGIVMSCDEYGDFYPTEMFSHIRPGDILWVSEAYGTITNDDGSLSYVYRATDYDKFGNEIKWKASLHMPKEAARLFLRVLRVRVQQLRSISKEDLAREGVKGVKTALIPYCTECFDCGNCWEVRPIDEFAAIWDSRLSGRKRRRYEFSKNPWVWVFDFELIKD